MANMFRCTLASGGALILTVTSDSAFAGQTITCTDGTTTLTQICPSTSPYTVEFKIPNGGTWTISSGTASTSVVIPDSIGLHNIPNGSTITPINNIQIWLHCANIWDKNYTTISQVLADASTLQTLIASNNAVDYMVRSTSWSSAITADASAMSYIGLNDYCADSLLSDSTWLNAICNSTYFESVLNVKVPTMTSDTTPSGVASASHIYSTDYDAFKAFDGNDSTSWATGRGYFIDQWIEYEFSSSIHLYLVNVTFYGKATNEYRYPKIYEIQGYDGNDWNTLASQTAEISSELRISFKNIINISNNFTKFRLIAKAKLDNVTSEELQIFTMQFYGRS